MEVRNKHSQSIKDREELVTCIMKTILRQIEDVDSKDISSKKKMILLMRHFMVLLEGGCFNYIDEPWYVGFPIIELHARWGNNTTILTTHYGPEETPCGLLSEFINEEFGRHLDPEEHTRIVGGEETNE